MFSSLGRILILTTVVLTTTVVASPARAAGRIDASTLIAIPHGTFKGVQ